MSNRLRLRAPREIMRSVQRTRRMCPRARPTLVPLCRPLILSVFACIVLTACGGGDNALTVPSASLVSSRENVSFFYQQITRTTNLSGLGKVELVVADIQHDDATAAARVKATGAKAYRYVQSYWFPKGRTYDGIDIGAHPDWAFCSTGHKPMVGRRDEFGLVWWFLDMNEQPV